MAQNSKFSHGKAKDQEAYYPGKSYGLARQGSGSIAPYPLRMLSLLIDWLLAVGISAWLFNYDPLANLLIFLTLIFSFTVLFGASPAQLILGLRIIPVEGQDSIFIRALIRTLTMLLIIGSVVLSKDKQPLHDTLAKTAVVRK